MISKIEIHPKPVDARGDIGVVLEYIGARRQVGLIGAVPSTPGGAQGERRGQLTARQRVLGREHECFFYY